MCILLYVHFSLSVSDTFYLSCSCNIVTNIQYSYPKTGELIGWIWKQIQNKQSQIRRMLYRFYCVINDFTSDGIVSI